MIVTGKQQRGLVHDLADADAVRRTVKVLQQRSRKPDSLLLRAFCRVLLDTARDIESEVR